MDLRFTVCAWLFGIMTGLGAAAPEALAQTPASQSVPPNSEWLRYPRASGVQLRDVAAVVIITPQVRPDVAVAIVNPGQLTLPRQRLSRNRVLIEGGLRGVNSCRARGGDFEAQVDGRWIDKSQLPIIYIRTPREVVVSSGGSTQIHVARADTLNIALDGCNDVDLEGASGAATVSIAGGGPGVRLYDSGDATVQIAGSGDVVLGVVRDSLTVSIAGSGDVVAARADGPTNIAISGSGDVTVREGRAEPLSIMIAGSGNVVHNGLASTMDVALLGGGDVRVARVTGAVNRRVLGGGNIVVGPPPAPPAPPAPNRAPAPAVPAH